MRWYTFRWEFFCFSVVKLVLWFEVNKKLLVQVFAKSLRNQNDTSTETRSYKIPEHNKGSHSDKRNVEENFLGSPSD